MNMIESKQRADSFDQDEQPAQAAHTPGPWICKDGMIYAENGDGRNIATCHSKCTVADGRLLAAAPALLAALKAWLNVWSDSDYTTEEEYAAVRNAQAAIAAAEGRAGK